MNHRNALANRHSGHAPRRAGQARVGKVTPVELYLDPGKLRDLYRGIFEKDPTLWSLTMVIFSLGQRLAAMRDVAAQVEAIGGGSLQLRLELERRVEDWSGLLQDVKYAALGQFDADEDEAAMASEIARRVFVEFPQDEGKWEYLDGGSQLPPRYGLAWEIGTLLNQVWATWHPILWIGQNGEPWYMVLPQQIAAGWVEAITDTQELAGALPEQGEGWGAQIGHAAEETEAAIIQIGQKGVDLVKAAASAGMALGVALLGGLFLLSRSGR